MECTNCGAKKLVPVTVKRTREIAGRVFTADVPARKCEACGEEYFEGKHLSMWSHEIVKDLVRNGPARGEALAFIRRASGYKAVELAALLDVTPQAMSRWENGKAPFDRQTWITIGRLALDRIDGSTETADRLRALTRRPRHRVHMKLAG
jgi:putative zinc finger/helix-turn-helix YgiT family protein